MSLPIEPKKLLFIALVVAGLVLVLFLALSWASRKSSYAGTLAGQRLPACPDTPNCVCSDAEDPVHAIPPLRLQGDPGEAWKGLQSAFQAMPGMTLVESREDYLRLECRTPLFGFIDDLELQFRPEEAVVAVRSASRVGRSDLGANRKRIESLRTLLTEKGLLSGQ